MYLIQHDEYHVNHEMFQQMLDLFKKHEHEHGMEKLMNEKLVHGSVYHDTTEMEMFVNLTDEVEDEDEHLEEDNLMMMKK